MGNVGRNAEYIQAYRHSYLNQHNSGDEWLTGFAGGRGRNALHLWKLLRPNFSVKCVIYGHPYYLRSCPVDDTATRPHFWSPPASVAAAAARISENYFELG